MIDFVCDNPYIDYRTQIPEGRETMQTEQAKKDVLDFAVTWATLAMELRTEQGWARAQVLYKTLGQPVPTRQDAIRDAEDRAMQYAAMAM